MPIKFYHSIASPPSRAVHMTLKALDLEFDLENVDLLAFDQKKPEYMKLNPCGLVPVIVDDDFVLSESQAIAAYLCNKYTSGDEKSLYPSALKERAIVDMMLSKADWVYNIVYHYLNLHDAFFHGSNMRKDELSKVEQALKVMNGFFEKGNFMAGNHLTIADFFGINGVLCLNLCDFSRYGEYPGLKAWIELMKSLPYFSECNEIGIKISRDIFMEKMKQHQ